MDPKDSLIEYPSDFPIKVMGANHIDFEATIVDVVLEHDPTFHIGRLAPPAERRWWRFVRGCWARLPPSSKSKSKNDLDHRVAGMRAVIMLADITSLQK